MKLPLTLTALAIVATVIFWFYPDGAFDTVQYISDGLSNITVGVRPPRPTPYPPTVHPNIESVGTPRPGVHVPL